MAEVHPSQQALIHTMVLASASDGNMSDAELNEMGETVRNLPVFRSFDIELLSETARGCVEMLSGDDGLDTVLNTIRDQLPDYLRETAYALAVDIVAADGRIEPEEVRLLELMRTRFGVDRLAAVAIERASRARHMTL